MSERENAYTHFRDTGEFLSGQAMSDMNRKAEEIADSEAIKLLAKINPDILTVDNIALTAKTLLQFAEQYAQEEYSCECGAKLRVHRPTYCLRCLDTKLQSAANRLTQHSGKGGK